MSKDEQNLSPEAQRKSLEVWCAANGAELVAIHEDHGVCSAAELEKRPALMAALESLSSRGAGVLLVAKRDRLARDVVLAAMIERLVQRAGARVCAASGVSNEDTPEAAMMRGIVDVFAQYERALIRARTRAALAVKRDRNEKTGGDLPIGFTRAQDGAHLAPNAAEAAALEQIRKLRAAGLSPGAIAEKLNEAGTPARGSRWHRTTVRRLLARKVA